ncbi:ATP-binding protein [Texcoconibacillus texcoconensis]|uniref:SpoVK/Ycf46/Vps4 family AAA+-type ATPase n=1 Tax=Texcoconibacillus texcoconensis TaxID=1095777 RepID=A0A840QUJ4_9BACI|nr:ATP-binding protein [Texcoconibacillus texcoconensis]MBB5175034.1 SpoVK/Ycf46/Vps4 family AAA+-type ATPase [Texcoconibacillus texcoconensis]
MFRKKQNDIQEVRRKTIQKDFTIKDQTCSIIIEGAPYASIDGEERLLDDGLLKQMTQHVAKSIEQYTSKYYPVPKSIHISNQAPSEQESEPSTHRTEEDAFLDVEHPTVSLDDVYIDEEMRQQLDSALLIVKHHKTLFEDWGLDHRTETGNSVILNFFGPPGTGKSMLAKAVAGELGQKLYQVNYADLESKYVGETPKNIKKAFQKAKEEEAILVFDEADSFLGKRLTDVNQSADYGVNITRSVMLMELERFDGIVIFTTNLVDNYDDAFRRRILANIPFTLPDEKGRMSIWSTHLSADLPLEKTITPSVLAHKYTNLTGADIKDMTLFAAINSLKNERNALEISDFDTAYTYIQHRYPNQPKVNVVKSETITEEEYQQEVQSQS